MTSGVHTLGAPVTGRKERRMSKLGRHVSTENTLTPFFLLKSIDHHRPSPCGLLPPSPKMMLPGTPSPPPICLPLQVLWGVTGTLTFFPTFPGLMSHHRPCLTGWDGPSLDQRQVRARRKRKACQLEGCSAWDWARVLPSQGWQLQQPKEPGGRGG